MCLCTPVCVSSPHTHSCCSREICYFESTCRHGETRSDAKRRHCRNPTFQHADIFCVDMLSIGGQTCACAAVGLLNWEVTRPLPGLPNATKKCTFRTLWMLEMHYFFFLLMPPFLFCTHSAIIFPAPFLK